MIAAGCSLRHGVKGLGAAGIAAGLVVFASLGQAGGGSTDPDATPVGAPTGSIPPASSAPTPGAAVSEPAAPKEGRSDTPEASAETGGQQDGDDPGDEPDDGGRQTVEVTRVIDGDTFEARGLGDGPVPGRVDVRMLEIDTVEEGQCGYEAATDKLAALLGDKITVERDEELKDQYGRYLLYAWNSDDTFVNLQMVETGYAEATLYEPNDKYWGRINAADTSDTYTPWPPCTTPEPQQDDSGGAYLFPRLRRTRTAATCPPRTSECDRATRTGSIATATVSAAKARAGPAAEG